MRSAPIGARFDRCPEQMDAYLRTSTRLTHSDPRALVGARAVALLAAWSVREQLSARPEVAEFLSVLRAAGPEDPEWSATLRVIAAACAEDRSVGELARDLGLASGVTGYCYHTVPVAAYAWFRHFGDFRASLSSVLDCGGDTDTAGAIAGALAGAVAGEAGIPPDWLGGLCEWPRGRIFLARLSDRLAERADPLRPSSPVRYFWPGIIARNLVFLGVVLVWGLRRLAPPY